MAAIRGSVHIREDIADRILLLKDHGISDTVNEIALRYYAGIIGPEAKRLAKLFSEGEWDAMRNACNGTAWTADSIRGGVLANIQDSLDEEITRFGAKRKELEDKLAGLSIGSQFALVETLEQWWRDNG